MVTIRTLLLFNLGVAALFAAAGAATHLFSEAAAQPITHLPTFDPASRKSLAEAEDIEALKGQALFYFDLARGLKVRQYEQDDEYLATVRMLSYLTALALAVSAGLAWLFARNRRPAPD